jgi:hypothetical protein
MCGVLHALRDFTKEDRVFYPKRRLVAMLKVLADAPLTQDIDRYTIQRSMSPKTFAGFRLEPEMLEGLRAIKERTGIPIAEQVRRAVLRWLEEQKAVEGKADRKRVGAHKRS